MINESQVDTFKYCVLTRFPQRNNSSATDILTLGSPEGPKVANKRRDTADLQESNVRRTGQLYYITSRALSRT